MKLIHCGIYDLLYCKVKPMDDLKAVNFQHNDCIQIKLSQVWLKDLNIPHWLIKFYTALSPHQQASEEFLEIVPSASDVLTALLSLSNLCDTRL